MQKGILTLYISLIMVLFSLTIYTNIILISDKALSQVPASSTEQYYNFARQWGSSGSYDGQFDSPQGIATDSSDNVYVADSENNRIQKFDSNGNFITKLGSYGDDNGQFVNPASIAIDSFGNLYITDLGNNRIEVFIPVTYNSLTDDSHSVNATSVMSANATSNSENATSIPPPFGISDQI